MKKFDLIVLGSGGAGYRAAMRCREAGWRVAVIEDNKAWGGTCDNRGCIPKKILAGAAELADANRRFKNLGIVTKPAELDWAGLIKFKANFTSPVSVNETRKPLEKAGIELHEGSPQFVSEDAIEVNGKHLTANYFHIAVGARPAKLKMEGAEHLATSDDFLSLAKLPKRIVLVGGGYISFELAHIAARFGAKVTILHSDKRPLPMFDEDTVKILLAASKEVGIEVVLNAAAGKLTKTDAGVTVHTNGKKYAADLAVHGAGRPPAIDTLNLDAANVKYEHRGVVVNDHLQSVSNPRVYSGGDAAAAGPPLSPVARLHGIIVADNLLGKKTKQPDYRSTPSVVFTEPPLAKVGLTEQEAKDNGMAVRAHAEDMATWFNSKRLGMKHTIAKTLMEKQTGKIVGAHITGDHAEDIINMFALAIEAGLTVKQFQAPIYGFPTPSDDARSMVG